MAVVLFPLFPKQTDSTSSQRWRCPRLWRATCMWCIMMHHMVSPPKLVTIPATDPLCIWWEAPWLPLELPFQTRSCRPSGSQRLCGHCLADDALAGSRKVRWHLRRIGLFFPECIARIPFSLWGSGGWGCVRSCVCVRSRPREGRMAVPMASSAKVVTFDYFWRFQTSRSLVSRGRRGTLWHSNMFHSVSKFVLCGRRNTFASFSEDGLHLWIFFVAGAAFHTYRVACFCESHCQGCVTWWQRANSVAGVAFCDMCWKLMKPRTKLRFWGVHDKTRQKASIL